MIAQTRISEKMGLGQGSGEGSPLFLRSVVCATVLRLVSAYYLRVLDHALEAMLRVEFTMDGRKREGMRAAIAEIERGHGEMIEGWKRQ